MHHGCPRRGRDQGSAAGAAGLGADARRLAKTFTFDSFRSALLFVERVGDSAEGPAEVAGHHPHIDIRSGTVRIAIPGRGDGLTHADVVLARRIEHLRGEHGHPVGMAGPT